MKYLVKIQPVTRHRSAIVKLILKFLGPGEAIKARKLAENGGVILENLNNVAATNCANQLRELGAQVEVNQMEENHFEDDSPTYEVKLIDTRRNKLAVIKVIREITGLGLKDSKELVDNLGVVATNTSKAEATDIRKKLEAKGTIVTILSESILEPTPLKNDKKNQQAGSDNQSQIKLIFDSRKSTVLVETQSGHKLQISEMNNSLLLKDQNGNKVILSQNGVHIN